MMSLSRLIFASGSTARLGWRAAVNPASQVGAARHRATFKGPARKGVGAKRVTMSVGPVETWYNDVPEGLTEDSPLTVEMGTSLQDRMRLDWKTEFLPKTVHIQSLPENYFDRAQATAESLTDLEGVMRNANETTIFDPDYFHARMPREKRAWQHIFLLQHLLVTQPDLPKYFVKDMIMNPGVTFRFLWTRHGRNIQTHGSAPYLFTSRHGLPPVLPPTDVEAMSEVHTFADTGPVSPLYGIDRAAFGEKKIEYGINKRSLLQYPHTLIIPQEYRSMTDTNGHIANCLDLAMFQFGILGAFAVDRLGYRMGHDVPVPLTMQALYFDGRQCLFSCFQLNTLDTDSDAGTKNFFWSQPLEAMYPHVQGDRDRQYEMEEVYAEPIQRYYSFLLNYDYSRLDESRLASAN